jgi:restriction endonuclease S subunit
MKQKLKDIAEIKFCLSVTSKVEFQDKRRIVTPSSFLENNVLVGIVEDDKLKISDDMKISKGDIVIKRIGPSFVNYIECIDDDVYAGGNLIIVRAKEVNEKYLAFVLNENVKKIIASLVGTKIPAIGRNDLEDVEIPLLSLQQQIAIGEIWFNSIKLKKLKQQLYDLENEKLKQQLMNYVI